MLGGTFIFLINTMVYQTTKIVFDLPHLKKMEEVLVFINSTSWKFETGTVITFLHIQMGHRIGMLWHQLVFPSNYISMKLPDSPSVFNAKVWLIIKVMDEIEKLDASKLIIFTYSLSCLQALHTMKLDHPLIGLVVRKCVFLSFGWSCWY